MYPPSTTKEIKKPNNNNTKLETAFFKQNQINIPAYLNGSIPTLQSCDRAFRHDAVNILNTGLCRMEIFLIRIKITRKLTCTVLTTIKL